ncbi:MAG: phosphoglycerate dehydrogenase [bacterium]
MRVLVSDKLSERGIALFKKEPSLEVDVKTGMSKEELIACIKEYDALAVRSETKVTAEVIEAAKKLKVVGRAGIGVDNVDQASASKKGIIVMNTPTGNTITTAEHAFALMLSLARNIPQANASTKTGGWEKKKFTGVELFNKTLGIIGMGRIGGEFAKRALGFGMRIIAYDPFLSLEKARELNVEVVDLSRLFIESDFITIHTPLTGETKDIINKDAFSKMKKNVRIINCARGGIVNEADLAEAVKNGQIAGAALDVFTQEPIDKTNLLLGVDKVICTPHLGASTDEAQENVSIAIAEQIIDYLKNGVIRNAVNAPSIPFELLKEMKPYITLAEKLGSLRSQLLEGRINRIKITYSGEILRHKVDALTVAVLKGILEPILVEDINFVNAPVLARDRGIKVEEIKSTDITDYSSLISIEVTTNKGKYTIAGALFNKNEPRVVNIDGYSLEAVLAGYMLIFYNQDIPGIIGRVGTILGEQGVNIAGMKVGREKQGGEAIAIMNIDSPVNSKALRIIRELPNVIKAEFVTL